MKTPRLEINLSKLRDNIKAVVDLAKNKGIDIWGVTKGVTGDKKIARLMIDNGIVGLADSRLINLKRLHKLDTPLMLLRIPQLSEVKDIIRYADISLNSELETIKALNKAAKEEEKNHKVVLMVDLGDRREGILPSNLISIVREVSNMEKIALAGVGTNLACFRGTYPTKELLAEFRGLVNRCEQKLGIKLEIITAGNSSSLPLLLEEDFRPVSNCYRVGETILLGREVPGGDKFPLTNLDTIKLRAEVVELKKKNTDLKGSRGQNAFGQVKEVINKGIRKRAILAVGKQDISPEGLIPKNRDIIIEGASSDHLVLDVTEVDGISLGAEVEFELKYSSLLRAMTSPYVKKIYRED